MRLPRKSTLATATLLLATPAIPQTPPHYTPDLASLRTHTVPAWFANAKLGIFIHWGLYSVPGWAPLSHPNHDFANPDYIVNDPYAEWYYNVMRIPGSPTAQYHREHFGDADYYTTFTPMFNQASARWNPDTWAKIFKDAGARYADRDLVGDFAHAMRKAGLRAGLYYSGGYDWTFDRGPIETNDDYGAVQPRSH